jgi:hypothetical protein
VLETERLLLRPVERFVVFQNLEMYAILREEWEQAPAP